MGRQRGGERLRGEEGVTVAISSTTPPTISLGSISISLVISFLLLPPLPLCCSITSTIKVQIWMRLKKGTQSVDPQAQHHLNSLILPGAVYLPHHRHHFLPTSLIIVWISFFGSCCGAILDYCFLEQIVLNNSRRYLLTKPPSCFAFFLF